VTARRALSALLIGLLTAVASSAPAAEPIRVSASVQNNEVAVGEPFALTIQIDGAQNVPVPSVEVDHFRADYLGPSTQVSMVNGHVTQSVGHRYRMIADREGQFTIGPFAITYDGKRYETAPITMRVRAAGAKPNAAAAGDQIKLVVKPGATEVYAGQRLPLDVTLYVGNVNVREMQFPTISADGLTVDKFDQPEQGSEVIDGRRYTAVRLHTIMTLVQPGQIELQGNMTLSVATSRRGGDPFFDQLFGGDAKPVQVQATPVPITVLPLPDAGRPADFSGAIGVFTFDLDAKPTSLDAGDPITLRMTLAGNGNLAALSPPAVPTGDAFRRYDPQPVKGEDSPTRRVFEQVLIPKSPAAHEIPAVRFSYFDPDARAYQTIVRGPVPIEVHAATAAQGQVVDAVPAGAPTPQPQAALGRDIVFIKDAPGNFAARGGGRGIGWLALLFALPVLAWAGLREFVRRRDRLAADPRLVRFRSAGREVRQALAAAAPDDAQALDRVSSALTTYLAAKLDLPPGAVERGRVLARLEAAGVDADLRQRVGRFLDLSEQARYAPARDAAAERRDAVALASGIVDGLERARGLERQLGVVALAMLGLTLLSPVRAEAPPPQAAFFQGNQAYADGRYADAVDAYDSVRRDGLSSGALEFNLGNAWMKQGDVGRAVAAYTRAARRLPRDPDVVANLAFAREQARVEAPELPLWLRVVAPFASSFTTEGLALAALLSWWALWGLLAARLWIGGAGTKLALGRVAAVIGVLCALLIASWATRVFEVEAREAVVVIAGGDTAARFEPSPSGTEHFAVTPGTTLGVLEERDDWLQVRRADGLRGWIPAAAVERVD
jgi:tetratricopeptide (TPR) repeat protein